MPTAPRLAFLVLAFLASACSAPEGLSDGASGASGDGPVPTDERVRTIQLYSGADEVSIPVISLRGEQALTLEFDILDDRGPRPLDIEFRRIERGDSPALLPTEYLTGFERDDIFDADPSGSTSIPYTHYEYTFPNATIGFRLGGEYRLRVSDPSEGPLFELPFFVSEEIVGTQITFGTRLAEPGAVGPAIQPAVRLTPRGDLAGADAYRFTVCFARDGNFDDLRCAPEPSLAELAIYGFYLPRAQAFDAPTPLYRLDLGYLGVNQEIREIDYGAIPPEATLEPDYAAFGGEFGDPTLISGALIDGSYRDAGQGDSDGEYVNVQFRYVPTREAEVTGPVYVRGAFTGLTPRPEARMTWMPTERRYEATLLVKQGLYAYDYVAPRATPRQRPTALGQPTVYTALVFYSDLTRFTERLVAVETAVTR